MQLLDLVRRDPPPPSTSRHDEPLGRQRHVRPERSREHLGQPGVALERGHVGRLVAADRPLRVDLAQRPRGELGDRGLGRLDLAERRQHVADVAQEAGVGADHQHALAGQLLAVREQQVRRPVQADRRLARTRRTLHADRLRQVGADDHVLLGLDGGDDVAHRPHARALDLLLEDRGVGRFGAGREVLVLERRQRPVLEAEPAPQLDAHRVGPGRPVERQADRRAPVDHHRVAVLVADVPPADVEVSDPVGVVESPEEQRDRRVVGELLHPEGERGPQVLAADPVAAGRGVHPRRPLTHPAQLLAGLGQVLLFGFEVGGRASRGAGGTGNLRGRRGRTSGPGDVTRLPAPCHPVLRRAAGGRPTPWRTPPRGTAP